jgi:branched-chain amino acid transport system substrate-binding protein
MRFSRGWCSWTSRITAGAAALVALGTVVGCGGSAFASSSASVSTSSGGTIPIGVLTDITGEASSSNGTSVQGAQAGLAIAKRDGFKLKFFFADTATSPGTALTAAQKLVEQDHVVAVLANSALTFAAAPYLKSQGIPVIGTSEDASEWNTDLNMFSLDGPFYTNLVTTTFGDFYKMEGGTTLGVIGYSISPSSSGNAMAWAASAQHAGLKVGYLNPDFAFGSTNVQPVAVAMKNAGVNAVTGSVNPNTIFALVTALKQEGVHLKMAQFVTGYGSDLTKAGPGAEAAAQDGYFVLGYEPVEMHTSATNQFEKDLATAGVSGEPSFGMYNGYESVGLLAQALKGAGSHPTAASLLKSLSHIKVWNALGLWGGRSLNINDRTLKTSNVDNCTWVTKFVGTHFHLVPGADPICGKTLGTT